MDPENSSSTDPESPTSSDVSFNTDQLPHTDTSHVSKDDESSVDPNIRRDEPKLPEEDEDFLDAYQTMVEVDTDTDDTGTGTGTDTDGDEPKPTVPLRLLGLYTDNPIYDIPNPDNNILGGLRMQLKAELSKRAVEKELSASPTKLAELHKRAAENEPFASRTKLPLLLPDQDLDDDKGNSRAPKRFQADRPPRCIVCPECHKEEETTFQLRK